MLTWSEFRLSSCHSSVVKVPTRGLNIAHSRSLSRPTHCKGERDNKTDALHSDIGQATSCGPSPGVLPLPRSLVRSSHYSASETYLHLVNIITGFFFLSSTIQSKSRALSSPEAYAASTIDVTVQIVTQNEARIASGSVIASEAKQSPAFNCHETGDCFVAESTLSLPKGSSQ